MLSATLQEGLRSYEIGAKVRALRAKKQMGLVQLAEHTGLSPALLSKIERNLLFPPLPTLYRIALVFGVGLEFFFAGAREKPVVALVRKDSRVRLPDRPGVREPSFRFESLDYPATERKFNAYLAEFLPTAVVHLQPHDHSGAEFVFVLRGQLTIRLGLVDYTLDAGDSLYFDPSAPHSYRRTGGRTCEAIVVTAP
ncbi:MAG: cupin domain-containing protein [Acidimicrobiia bacterium]|nr:cupin domain-containing protein [Acidimicrobiia bacterium]